MYDQTTGQVFKEWSVPRRALTEAGSRDELDWSRRRRYPVVKSRGALGPRSLVDTAISVIANNIGEVDEQHLEGLPQRMVSRLWHFLEARGACFHAWKIFSKFLLPRDEDKTLALYRHREHICQPRGGLKQYIQPLMSPNIDFITHLVISGGNDFTTSEMLFLTDIKNLGVLEIIQPADELGATFPQITDRLVRGWSEKPNPFPLLRVLRIWGDQTTTQGSLRWVSKFPSLTLYDVKGAREDWASPDEEAIDQGWEAAGPSSSGIEDSLLRYLMLFSQLEETIVKPLRDLARSIDSDLLSLCGDSGCEVKFVPSSQAPPLLDYLTDTAKISAPSSWQRDGNLTAARACHGIAFEAWAFWLYSLIGQLNEDRDLEAAGARTGTQTVVGPFVLPSKPIASLFLGHSGRGGISLKPSYVSRGLFATNRHTFTRLSALRGATTTENASESAADPKTSFLPTESVKRANSIRSQKRKRLNDMLGSLRR